MTGRSTMDPPGDLVDRFARVLREAGVLREGRFKLKSGVYSPYFVDFGSVADGESLEAIGRCYAEKLVDAVGPENFDVVFGPSYKGIPIALACVTSLWRDFGIRKRYAFNRKVLKDYGEMRRFLGDELAEPVRVVIVDDVITDGGTKYESLALLAEESAARPIGVVVGVDRSEGNGAREQFVTTTGLSLWAIMTIDDLTPAPAS